MAQIHTIAQGECILTIAKKYGFSNWMHIAGAPENKELMDKRGDPTCLMPGDKITIPDLNEKSEVIATGKKHTFKVNTVKAWFNMTLIDEADAPIPDTKYTLEIESHGIKVEGTSDGDGAIKEKIPVDAKEGVLTVVYDDEELKIQVMFGHKNPITEVSGKKSRLRDLGYYDGEINDNADDQYKAALEDFADRYDLGESFTDRDIEEKLSNILNS